MLARITPLLLLIVVLVGFIVELSNGQSGQSTVEPYNQASGTYVLGLAITSLTIMHQEQVHELS